MHTRARMHVHTSPILHTPHSPSRPPVCRFPTSTGADLAQKLYTTPSCKDSRRFSKPKRSNQAFTVDHYAGDVTYETTNFLVGRAHAAHMPARVVRALRLRVPHVHVHTRLSCLSSPPSASVAHAYRLPSAHMHPHAFAPLQI